MTAEDLEARLFPPSAGDERTLLLGFLERQRALLAWKCEALDAIGMATTVAVSTVTLGGLLRHLTWTEWYWFDHWLLGAAEAPPFVLADWDEHWATASSATPGDLRSEWEQQVEHSRSNVSQVLTAGGLDQPAKRSWSTDDTPSLRWILLHMIEEYARHIGHADLIRESIDGQVGEDPPLPDA